MFISSGTELKLTAKCLREQILFRHVKPKYTDSGISIDSTEEEAFLEIKIPYGPALSLALYVNKIRQASKPIEVEVKHKNYPLILPDAKHGLRLNAKWIDNTTRIAPSPMTMFCNTPVTITNNPISTGSFVFTGSALVFHKTDGVPFTITYTLDAMTNSLTK
ncbi:MAG: hypothetical protein WBE34_16385 [Candidatus Nitrosopolaris sp.]